MKISSVSCYLSVNDASAALDFYSRAFGATEAFRLTSPDGRIAHAEMSLGANVLMLADEFPEMDALGPIARGGSTCRVYLAVEDCDAVIAQAETCGAEVIRPASDQFFGERTGHVRCPFGHDWLIAHTIEKVDPEEMQRRFTEMMSKT